MRRCALRRWLADMVDVEVTPVTDEQEPSTTRYPLVESHLTPDGLPWGWMSQQVDDLLMHAAPREAI